MQNLIYTPEDIRSADALVRRYSLILAAALAVLLAAYVSAIILGSRIAMLLILQMAFWFSALEIALWLRPSVRYRGFLRDMRQGLRRECVCRLLSIDENIQHQDGVRVHGAEVRLEGGDTRIFYFNASKHVLFPGTDAKIRIHAFGRHVVQWEEIPC